MFGTDTESVTRTAKCKRCESKTCAWQTSAKSGKWYLTEVFTYDDGALRTNYKDFHSTYCGKPELHEAKQAEITAAVQARQAERDNIKVERELKIKRTQEEADARVLGWYSMTKPEILARLPVVNGELAEEERKLKRETGDRYTMDDFHEQNKQIARIAGHRASIKWLTAERDVLMARLDNES